MENITDLKRIKKNISASSNLKELTESLSKVADATNIFLEISTSAIKFAEKIKVENKEMFDQVIEPLIIHSESIREDLKNKDLPIEKRDSLREQLLLNSELILKHRTIEKVDNKKQDKFIKTVYVGTGLVALYAMKRIIDFATK